MVLSFRIRPSATLAPSQNDLFLELSEGYAKALDKSTSRPLSWREVFEHSAQRD